MSKDGNADSRGTDQFLIDVGAFKVDEFGRFDLEGSEWLDEISGGSINGGCGPNSGCGANTGCGLYS